VNAVAALTGASNAAKSLRLQLNMLTILHSPTCMGYEFAGHPESPQRIHWALSALLRHKIEWYEPSPCSDEDILRVHTPEHLESVKLGSFFDADTRADPKMYEHARLAAGAAIGAAEVALNGHPAFSLMRPPGHHAERNRVMGFCYFNNIAVAVARVLEKGAGAAPATPTRVLTASPRHTSLQLTSVRSAPARRVLPPRKVAILDFDCHHGNGTENIFRDDDRVLFVSVHQSPCYPGTGLHSIGNIHNYPLPPHTHEREYLELFDEALQQIAAARPALLAVSAGFDAYQDDPITEMGLEIETFRKIGERITALKLPTFAVLEGGYSPQLGRCIEEFLMGWAKPM